MGGITTAPIQQDRFDPGKVTYTELARALQDDIDEARARLQRLENLREEVMVCRRAVDQLGYDGAETVIPVEVGDTICTRAASRRHGDDGALLADLMMAALLRSKGIDEETEWLSPEQRAEVQRALNSRYSRILRALADGREAPDAAQD